MTGARIGNCVGALVGFIVGIAAYEIFSNVVYELPDSSDRASFVYDDFFIPYP